MFCPIVMFYPMYYIIYWECMAELFLSELGEAQQIYSL
jgi:hypothetical protein